MKTHFRSKMIEYATDVLKNDWEKLAPQRRSDIMTKFYVKNVLGVLSTGLVPENDEDIENCIIDGKGELGIDFIYRDNGRVLLIQTKFRGKSSVEDSSEFDKFCSVLDKLFREDEKKFFKNRQLEAALSEIDWYTDQFEMHFITLSRGSENIRAREAIGQHSIQNLPGIEDRVSLKFMDESDLNSALRDAENSQEFIQEPVSIIFSQSQELNPWLTYVNSSDRVCYMGFINGGQLYELLKSHPHGLFSMNIRNYLGDVATNKAIVNTAIKEPENFFFFNNGISAVATKIEPEPSRRTLKCTRFCIINGAQTVNSIKRAYERDKARNARETEILLRVTCIEYDKDNVEDGFLDRVTKFNNTQNAIKLPDFRSNDPIQKDLKNRFEKLSSPDGKKFQYKNKRSRDISRNKIPIGMEEFCKAIHSFRFGPPDYFGGTSYLFDPNPGKGYAKVFGDGNEVWTCLSNSKFQILAGTWFLCWAAGDILREVKMQEMNREEKDISLKIIDEGVVKPALERKWLVYFVLGELMRVRHNNDELSLDNALAHLSDPNWTKKNNKKHDVLCEYVKMGCGFLIRDYRREQRNVSFSHRDWFRNDETLKRLRAEIRDSDTATLSRLSLF